MSKDRSLCPKKCLLDCRAAALRLCVFIWMCAACGVAAEDWPQFLGPRRDGSSGEKIHADWRDREPKISWSIRAGSGFSGPVVLGKRVILFHREGSLEVLAALDSATGKLLWQSKARTDYRDDFGFDEGPRATPCIHEDRVYSMGAEGLVRCVALADGKELWSVDTRKRFNAAKGFFGMACSPLVHGSNVVVNIGGASGAGIVALDKTTGVLRWKATTHEASYASPASTSNLVVFLTREGLVVVESESGKVRAERPWRARMHASVNAASPLLIDGMIFATASYDTGAMLVQLRGNQLEEVWSGDEAISSHYATPVHSAGHLYGFHGRQEMGPSFRCIDLKTGKVLWDEARFGSGSVTLAGTNLLILRESGELVIAPATPKGFEIRGRTQILGSDTRAMPALSNQRLFARDKRNLVCAELP